MKEQEQINDSDSNGYKPVKYIRTSSLSTFACCPRKFFYAYGLRLRTIGEHIALKFGEAIHAGAARAHEGDITGAMIEFKEVFGENDLKGDQKRNSFVALGIFKDFAQRHQPGVSLYNRIERPKGSVDIKGISTDEVVFAIDLGFDVPFVGRIDLFARHRDTGELWVVDYKTTTLGLGDWFFKAFEQCPQAIGYSLAGSIISNERVKGMMIEGLLVAKTKAEGFVFPVEIKDDEIRDWLSSVGEIRNQMLEFEERNHWPKNRYGCHPYACHGSGGFQCKYFDLCSVDDWRSLEGLFVVDDEDPYEMVVRNE